MRNIMLLFSLGLLNSAFGQQSPLYFDFWTKGQWVSELTIFEGDTIAEKDRFYVSKLEGKNAFMEEWEIYIGDGEYVHANAMRAFDNESEKWKLFYVDDINAQIWDSQALDDKVYFLKEFIFQEKNFYSRQAWSLQSDGSVLRTIERSVDNFNWAPRYIQVFRKRD